MSKENFYAADLGNSRIKIAQILGGSEIADIQSIPNYEFLQKSKIDTEFSQKIVFASVNSKTSAALRENNQIMQIYEIGVEIEIPITNKTDKPEQTGIDRLINCWWAYDFYKKPAIVIDAGTAITIDFCNEKGEFEGGVIMAGAELQLRAMNMFTSALPSVKYEEKLEISAIGKTTEEAMLASVKYGIPGQIKACVDEMIESSRKKPVLILTGGNSHSFSNQLSKIFKKHKLIQRDDLPITAICGIAKKFFD